MRDHDALLALLRARAARPWRRGDSCAAFAADAVRAQTGRDPMAGLRREARSKRGRAAILRRFGGLEAAVTARLGDPIAPAAAARGDVALVETDGGALLAIVEGPTLVGPDATGLRRLPRGAMIKAWRADGEAGA